MGPLPELGSDASIMLTGINVNKLLWDKLHYKVFQIVWAKFTKNKLFIFDFRVMVYSCGSKIINTLEPDNHPLRR